MAGLGLPLGGVALAVHPLRGPLGRSISLEQEVAIKRLATAAIVTELITVADCGDSSPGSEQERASELSMQTWMDEIDPEIRLQLENEFGAKTVEHPYSTDEEMMASVQGAAASYDPIVPSDRMVASWSHFGLIAQVDLASIPGTSSAWAEVTAD